MSICNGSLITSPNSLDQSSDPIKQPNNYHHSLKNHISLEKDKLIHAIDVPISNGYGHHDEDDDAYSSLPDDSPISHDDQFSNSLSSNLSPTFTSEKNLEKTVEETLIASAEESCSNPPESIPKLKTEPETMPKEQTYHNVYPDGLSVIENWADNDLKPLTIPHKLKYIADTNPQAAAYYYKTDGEDTHWESVTYREYLQDIRRVAKAFLSLGLEKFHAVTIIGFNAPEWVVSNFAAIFAGGLSTGVYTTNSAEVCFHIMMDCKANICVVEDWNQMNKVLSVADKLPNLKAIIQYREQDFPSESKLSHARHFKILKWSDLDRYSEMTSEDILNEKIESQKPNNCSTLIYTSGTTGNSKGVMISHDNLIWTSTILSNYIKSQHRSERMVSYLPLSHVAAQMTDIYMLMESASSLWFAKPDALKCSLVTTLKEAKPTIFMGVPRKSISDWAKDIGKRGSTALMKGDSLPWGHYLANRLVFSRIKTALGLNHCRFFISTGAPCSSATLTFFESLDIRIQEVYGASECTGPASVNYPEVGFSWIGSSGPLLPGTQVKIMKRDPIKDRENQDAAVKYGIKCEDNRELGNNNCSNGSIIHISNGDVKTLCSSQDDILNEDMEGEILIKGRHVFMGYLNMPQQTIEAIDLNGWFSTGDMGKLTKTSTGGPFLYITGRLKELIVTAGGENIAPIPIENIIKEQLCELVSNVMVIGDYRKFLSVILTFKTEIDINTGLCSQTLLPSVQKFILDLINQVSSTSSKITDSFENNCANADECKKESTYSNGKVNCCCNDKKLSMNSLLVKNLIQNMPLTLKRYIDDRIDVTNTKAVSRAAFIRKWVFLESDFTIPGGELGPTMKLRRPYILNKYSQVIESFYSDSKEINNGQTLEYRTS
ncbi:unnamed protein product [Gordionus sp. m RMFG-2023]